MSEASYLRMCVSRVDGDCVWGHAENVAGGELCLRLDASGGGSVWRHVAGMSRCGTRLNIVGGRRDGHILLPEMVIVEPDYLVDVTSIASCFESYGHTPLTHLLSQLPPHPPTQATLLGQMASQLLDEEVTLSADERRYAQSARRFFKSYAVALASTPVDASFHAAARQQQQNIRRAIHTDLRQYAPGFDASQVVLEPSFYSEMLGLQGRMDFLTRDFSVLIEQKSGRCGYPQRDASIPVQAEKHYVQMLLYMLVLRYNFGARSGGNGHGLRSFLLYSKYALPLLPLGFSQPLVAEALRVRNALASAEFGYVRDGLCSLSSMTADALNVRHTQSALWTRYQRPRLEATLSPIRDASALARSYFLRMLRFVRTEHLIAKVGDARAGSHGFAEKWHLSLAAKLDAGSIAAGMTLEPVASHGHVTHLRFRLGALADGGSTDFRQGDIVVAYPYATEAEPDVRGDIVFRATIVELTTEAATLRLRAPQCDGRLFAHAVAMPWAMEHDFMEASYASLYRGLHAMLCAPARRRELLLMQRAPLTDPTLRLRGDYGSFNELALRVRQARELFLIIGPPGTGKTSYGLMTTLAETLLTPSASALLVAFTNRAVDEICSKLHGAGLDFVRLGGTSTSEAWLQPYLLESRVASASDVGDVRHIIMDTRIVVATVPAVTAQEAWLRMRRFDVAIVDEASQILEPQLLPLWCATTTDGLPSVDKFVLIGDHCQLAAVVQQDAETSRVEERELHEIMLHDCRDSLFERLLRRYRHDARVCYMLTRQGRMHPAIADFPSRAFYGGRLEAVPLAHQLAPSLGAGRRVVFLDVRATEGMSEKVNAAEAEAIAALTAHLRLSAPEHTLGIIVPYRNQIGAIRRRLVAHGVADADAITIDTVERYQGSERDIIIYGFTVSHAQQLTFLTATTFVDEGRTIDRKLNVAMTRARERLILVGNKTLLSRDPVYAALIEWAGTCSEGDLYGSQQG
ncbi:MAG: AAA family ATPase [Bacteroidaceae bacterium]|nr:AAA family ATPase [Bacteroidaceae bacterium]